MTEDTRINRTAVSLDLNLYNILNVDLHANMDQLYEAHRQLERQLLFGLHSEDPLVKSFYQEDVSRAYDTLLEKQRREKYHFETFGEVIDGDTGKVI
ncbi:hypothetical protein J4421_05785 [Candidatus Woesearchaeota archaeon]|nr:hypothetical protein [Candidatus Woesearchaeota archaeon]